MIADLFFYLAAMAVWPLIGLAVVLLRRRAQAMRFRRANAALFLRRAARWRIER